jgi:DNA-binding XRE family transcriptional regulator
LATHPEPNVSDPLAEHTVNRRMWAAYLRAGYNRNTFAPELGITYQGLHLLDVGKSTPKLSTLCRVSELTGFTLDQLVYGHHSPGLQRMEKLLADDDVRAVLFEIRASTEQIEALAEYHRSVAGSLQPLTRSFVSAFVERYALARSEGSDHPVAIQEAKASAVNARENAAAAALRRNAPPTDVELEAVGKALKAGTLIVAPTAKMKRPRRRTPRPSSNQRR